MGKSWKCEEKAVSKDCDCVCVCMCLCVLCVSCVCVGVFVGVGLLMGGGVAINSSFDKWYANIAGRSTWLTNLETFPARSPKHEDSPPHKE